MAELMLVNPRKRRARRKTTTRKARRVSAMPVATPRRRRRATSTLTRYRRNPIRRLRRGGMGGIVNNVLMPAATAAGGALALDVAWSYLPIPDNIKSGPLRYAAKGVGALALGFLAANFVKKETADRLALGAMTVVMHDAARDMMGRFMPQIPLSMYVDPQAAPMLGYAGSGMVSGSVNDWRAQAGWNPEAYGMGMYVDPKQTDIPGMDY